MTSLDIKSYDKFIFVNTLLDNNAANTSYGEFLRAKFHVTKSNIILTLAMYEFFDVSLENEAANCEVFSN